MAQGKQPDYWRIKGQPIAEMMTNLGRSVVEVQEQFDQAFEADIERHEALVNSLFGNAAGYLDPAALGQLLQSLTPSRLSLSRQVVSLSTHTQINQSVEGRVSIGYLPLHAAISRRQESLQSRSTRIELTLEKVPLIGDDPETDNGDQ